jgi:hypothetical protein
LDLLGGSGCLEAFPACIQLTEHLLLVFSTYNFEWRPVIKLFIEGYYFFELITWIVY